PGKEREILTEPAPHFRSGNAALVGALPFAAEIVDGGTIEIVTVALHRCVICENSPLRPPSPHFGIASIVLAEVSERPLAASPSHSVAATNLDLGTCISWRLRAPSVPVPHRPR